MTYYSIFNQISQIEDKE